MPPPQRRVLLDTRLATLPELSDRDLDTLATRTADLTEAKIRLDGGGIVTGTSRVNQLSEVIEEVREQRSAAQAAIAPAVLALILVALAMLLRLLSASADLRVPELALASLRGTGRRRTWILGLAEPLILIALSAPLGVLAGYGATHLLVDQWLRPGIPLDLPSTSLAASGVVILGAIAAAVLAVSGALREPLGARLSGTRRPHAGSRSAVVIEVVLIALALTLPLTRTGKGNSQGLDATGLLLPVALALTAGLLATRLVRAAATWYATHRSGGALPGFIAARALARRAAGTLVMLPVTAAIAVAIFANGVSNTASDWRASLTSTRTPADMVYTSPLSLEQTMSTVADIDPDGRYLAVAAVAGLRTGPVVLLDSQRLPRVGAWSEQWLDGATATEVAQQIAPPGSPVRITGQRLAVTLTNDTEEAAESNSQELTVRLLLDASGTGEDPVYLGPFTARTDTMDIAVPQCASGCDIAAISVGAGRIASATPLHGTLSLESLRIDGAPVQGFARADAWEPTAPGLDITAEGDSLRLDLDTGDAAGAAAISTTAYAGPLRALVATDAGATVRTADESVPAIGGLGASVPVAIVGEPLSTPFLGPRGTVLDLATARARLTLASGTTTAYVLARADTPPELTTALVATGAELDTRAAQTRAELDASPYAQALKLYQAVGAMTLLLAIGGLLVSLAVQLPARRRDAAALRVIGMRPFTIAAASAIESLVTLSTAALAGLAAGVAAQALLLRSLTLGVADDRLTPPVLATIGLERLALSTLTITITLVIIATASAITVVRRAQAASLREAGR